ncbi:MAG: HAD-IIIA family hydrolase [Microscillaceae bacterium]|jgi:D-glycero-D-manno-heptose 1,7-bisphosphate phosphatase|nr:HAD-IIIA family hydrolase [Microscillaceae bacterium]
MPNKCIFLDRDGVLNEDRVDYAYTLDHFVILPRVAEALQLLKDAGYLLIIITNQSGIAKGIYTADEVQKCYDYLQENCNQLIDYQYFAPYHPKYDSDSLTRKPDSLMIEKAVAKFDIAIADSWFVGDAERDMAAAKKQDLRTIQIIAHKPACAQADFTAFDLYEAAQQIVLA